MKFVIYITIVLPIFLQAITLPLSLKNPLLYEEQRKIFEEQQKARQTAESIYTELTPIPLSQDKNTSQACIQIESIDTENITLIDKEVLDALIKPYLHRCDTMHDINTLVKKINNIYIEKAYVTSRAYIKPQDLSKGHLVITAMEGKIESVSGKNISTALVFPFIENEALDLRDLEMGLEQLNRLQSVQATMSINPGNEEGFSQIAITGKKIGSVIHGSLGVNNYGKPNYAININKDINL